MRGNSSWKKSLARVGFATTYARRRRKSTRRRLRVEALETRTLLTAAPWQNVDKPLDTNNDDDISPIDVLVIANHLSSPGTAEGETAGTPDPSTYPDVNGDSAVTTDDADLVVEYLNTASATTEPTETTSETTTPIDPPPPPPDPCDGISHPSVTIDGIPTDVDEMEVFTVSGSMPDAYYAYVDMGDAWVEQDFYYDASAYTWTTTGYYDDDTGSGTASDPRAVSVTVGNICYDASTSASLTVHNVDPTLDSISTSGTVDEGSEASVTVTFSDAVSVSDYSMDEWTIEIDWGDGTTTTHEASGTYYGSYSTYMGQMNSLTATHVYVDDVDPGGAATPQDTYTITATITDDDTGTDSATASITVNNVDPTVSIDSITAIDNVLATDDNGDPIDWLNPGQLDESEGFQVTGTVTDPGVADTHTATLKVDLNFDGDVSDAGETVSLSLQADPYMAGHWMFEQTISEVPDDGPSPGNDTTQDPLDFNITVDDDDTGQATASSSLTIYNVAPFFEDDFEVSFNYDSEHNISSVVIAGSFVDHGNSDVHELDLTWADGVLGDGAVNPVTLSGRSYSVTRPLSPSQIWTARDLFPLTLILLDDDKGRDEVELECDCFGADELVDVLPSNEPTPTEEEGEENWDALDYVDYTALSDDVETGDGETGDGETAPPAEAVAGALTAAGEAAGAAADDEAPKPTTAAGEIKGPIKFSSGDLEGTAWVDGSTTAYPDKWDIPKGRPFGGDYVGVATTIVDKNAGKPCGDGNIGSRVWISAFAYHDIQEDVVLKSGKKESRKPPLGTRVRPSGDRISTDTWYLDKFVGVSSDKAEIPQFINKVGHFDFAGSGGNALKGVMIRAILRKNAALGGADSVDTLTITTKRDFAVALLCACKDQALNKPIAELRYGIQIKASMDATGKFTTEVTFVPEGGYTKKDIDWFKLASTTKSFVTKQMYKPVEKFDIGPKKK